MTLVLTLLLAACGGSDAPTTEAPAAEQAEARTVQVAIDGTGYTPSSIDAKPGETITIEFTRADANNCGGEVVFPDSGERREIPVGEPVAVTVTAPSSGELAFTCGMSMYEGAVVVSGS